MGQVHVIKNGVISNMLYQFVSFTLLLSLALIKSYLTEYWETTKLWYYKLDNRQQCFYLCPFCFHVHFVKATSQEPHEMTLLHLQSTSSTVTGRN